MSFNLASFARSLPQAASIALADASPEQARLVRERARTLVKRLLRRRCELVRWCSLGDIKPEHLLVRGRAAAWVDLETEAE